MKEQGETIRFGLRLPKWLYEHLANKAVENNRSINSEIIARLNPKVPELLDANPKLSELLNAHTYAALRLSIEAHLKLFSMAENRSHYDELINKLRQYVAETPQEMVDKWVSRELKMMQGEDGLK